MSNPICRVAGPLFVNTRASPSNKASAILALLLTASLLAAGNAGAQTGSSVTLEVWYSFASESKEEETFLDAISSFEAANPHITVEATMVPYANADQLFMTAAQGGEAPDLVRLSSDQLGKIGEVRVDGFPLLEDLRPHLTPDEQSRFDARALAAMHYGDSLMGIPASQDCLSLIYNKALFDAEGLDYPDSDWTTGDLLSAAENLTNGDIQGLALPVKVAYWWFPFQEGFGGNLFDDNGTPTLDSNGSAEALDWLFSLEKEHGVVATGTQIESMKSQFISSKAAMIVDGPWNWATYEASRLDIGQELLPTVEETGLRASPLVTYKGWSVTKQSTEKVAATDLALHLSSAEVQRAFALDTYTMPTSLELFNDPVIANDEVISGFLEQAQLGTPAPTTRGMALVYGPLGTAFEQVYTDSSTSVQALSDANEELLSMLAESQQAAEMPLIEGYRTATIQFTVDPGYDTLRIVVDGENHSTHPTNADCSTSADLWTCNLTGLVPGAEHQVEVFGWTAPADEGSSGFWTLIANMSSTTEVEDIVPPPADTSPILFAVGAIVLSLIALLSFLRWQDAREGKSRSKLAHLYVAPALVALAVLTFYPVFYGMWLAFTDADQTHLGENAWVGLANFVEVLTSSGFVRVTLFTLIWTVLNVTAHIGFGLLLALMLNNKHIRGRVAYRTILLLPWAIPSYISVLVWRGMLEPAGLINDLLGTDLNLLADPTGAKALVIMVNIWLGIPFMMMSLSGALQSLPGDMYEAAEVDGVGAWSQFRHLTMPNLKSAMVPLSLLGFIWTFNMFNVIYLMTDGGPNLYFGEPGATDILITYVYDVAFRDGAYGVAAAWSVVIFLMLLTFSWVYLKRTNATEAVT
jgi:arabinogalactan oligomer/maltooligosaccharide transport system permease protein